MNRSRIWPTISSTSASAIRRNRFFNNGGDSMRKSIFYAASALMALVCQPALAKEIKLNLTAKEVSTSVDNKGTMQASWTYEGQMPGPLLRVTEGDTITIVLTNDAAKDRSHSIERHRSEESRVGKECVSTCRSGWEARN